MTAYYNEIDPYAAQWLRNLIAAGHIAPGDVDERSIVDIQPDDLKGYTQCHFFAGIGGWSYALRLAGWDDDRPVWTGSCPCQPLSSAGQRKGHVDERHLWPTFYNLIAQRPPSVVFGEQVASKDGREWLSGVRVDLEGLGYACGAADLCAAGVGAPHRRQRLYWVAHATNARHDERVLGNEAGQECTSSGDRQNQGSGRDDSPYGGGTNKGVADTHSERQPWWKEQNVRSIQSEQSASQRHNLGGCRPWDEAIIVECSDGNRRASSEPRAFPLAHGVPGRVGRLRAYGNAIVPQVAAEVIGAYMEIAA